MPRLIVGLPHLSRGPLMDAALRLNAPVMISAGALAKWVNVGEGRFKSREWRGWNTKPLDRALETGLEIHMDSAGFVAMFLRGGYDWTPESYVEIIGSHPAVTRYSSMDFCVEPEVAANRAEVRERIARTINLNKRCYRVAQDIGSTDRLMPVIQGAIADDFVSCFDAISGIVGENTTIGVGSMCRRKTHGNDGSIAILEHLDKHLPKGIRLHLFGLKSDGAEAACALGDRIDTVDSQAYGVRARRIANDRRATDPAFSKSNAFVAEVMTSWYEGQVRRLESPRTFSRQAEFSMDSSERPEKVIDAAEWAVRSQLESLIAEGSLDHDQILGGRIIEESVMEILADLPDGVSPMERWRGPHQLPADITQASWFPQALAA